LLTVEDYVLGLQGGQLFESWFFVSGKHALVSKAFSYLENNRLVPSATAYEIMTKQGMLWCTTFTLLVTSYSY
jgi:hypothetical protein